MQFPHPLQVFCFLTLLFFSFLFFLFSSFPKLLAFPSLSKACHPIHWKVVIMGGWQTVFFCQQYAFKTLETFATTYFQGHCYGFEGGYKFGHKFQLKKIKLCMFQCREIWTPCFSLQLFLWCSVHWFLPKCKGKDEGRCMALKERTSHRTTEHHLSYGITQCYLPRDRGERAPP